MTRGVSIANNGSMPFDGWVQIICNVWGASKQVDECHAYINNVLVNNASTMVTSSGDNATVWLPVKKGDIYKTTSKSSVGGSTYAACTLYPYEAAPEEE